MKKAQEEFCKCCFNLHLMRFVEREHIKWEEELGKSPDYYLWIDGTKYAVEVSTIPDILRTVGSKEFSIASFTTTIQELVCGIEAHTLREGILSGKYHAMFWGPFSNFKQARKRIEKGFVDYIRRTQRVDQAPLEMVINQGAERCAVERLSAEKQCIITSFSGPNLSEWEAKAQEEACRLLQSIVERKASLLQQITLPKILVLEDAYPLVQGKHVYATCIRNILGVDTFETIFIVETHDRGYVLHGKSLADYAGFS
jgi:hypothetical protein